MLPNHKAYYRAISQRDARFDGRFFTAVKTTGIYCRPICPARTPLSKNVIFYPTAAAAQEAGFRPCLRCRPETAPDLGAWRGTSNTVSRALALIEFGALDEGSVDALANRVGVGERQLRRLFLQHMGASPVAVAQTRRVLLAKQLIHETRLPMAEIAFAAGFGSIRRFNETFSALYDSPPRDLRRSNSSNESATYNGELRLLLRYRPPYDWTAILAFLKARAIEGIEVVSDDCYARSFDINGAQGTVLVRHAEKRRALEVSVRCPNLSVLPAVIARLRRVFDLAADPLPIVAHLAKDRALAPLVRARPGLRVPGAWDGFELAMRAVLGQQITVKVAKHLAGRLVARYGEPLEKPVGAMTHVFPRSARLASADLSPLGLPRKRAATLSAVAQAAVSDPRLFDATGDLQDNVRRLCEISGIGEWTAHYIALRQLREPDAFPAADVGLIRAMASREGQKRSAVDLQTRSETWSPWRAYAAQHLWAST
jgi:AraC family transcriptional regulator, regulatory protein of adaptative response / DNA-3-methyladenine glycosylase II